MGAGVSVAVGKGGGVSVGVASLVGVSVGGMGVTVGDGGTDVGVLVGTGVYVGISVAVGVGENVGAGEGSTRANTLVGREATPSPSA